jgi:hypothetical protein
MAYSALILVHDFYSIYFSGLNPYKLDILLQVSLILYVWLCPIPNVGVALQPHVQPALNGLPRAPVLEQCVAPVARTFHGLRRDAPVLHDFQQVHIFQGLQQAPIHHGSLWQAPPYHLRVGLLSEEDNVPFVSAVSEAYYWNQNEQLETGYFHCASSIEDNYVLAVWPIPRKSELVISRKNCTIPYQKEIVSDICTMNEHPCHLETWPLPDKQENVGELVTTTHRK